MKALRSCATAMGALSLFVGSAKAEVTTSQFGAGTPTSQSPAETYFWDFSFGGALPLRPQDTHVCFLTGFRGGLADNGAVLVHRSTVDVRQQVIDAHPDPTFAVPRNDLSDVWKLDGWQNDANVSGDATCTPFSAFITENGGTAQVSGFTVAYAQTPLAGFECDTRSFTGDVWNGEATTWLSGIAGGFESFNEFAGVEEPQRVSDPAKVRATVEACTEYIFAFANSMFIDRNSPGTYPNTMGTTTQTANTNQSFAQPLARTRDAVCYLKQVGGSIQGGGEGAVIEPQMFGDQEWWVLTGNAAGGHVRVKASCLRYDQRPDAPPILDNIP